MHLAPPPLRSLVFFVLPLFAAVLPAQQPAVVRDLPLGTTTVLLEPTRDNTLYEEMGGALSNGSGSRLFCGNTQIGEKRRGLLFFDVAANIPLCSKILSVELVMSMVKTISGPQDVTLHRVQQSWGEAGSVAFGGQGGGALSVPGDATWVHRFFSTTTWTTPGGDFDVAASGTAVVDGMGAYTWASTPAMVADVQQWLDDDESNHGWMVRTIEVGGATAKAFATREEVVESLRPFLRVLHVPPRAVVNTLEQPCAAPGGEGPLMLEASGLPVVPSSGFALHLRGCAPGTQSIFLWAGGVTPSPVPLPGGGSCVLLIDATRFLVALPGDADHRLHVPIPDLSGLLGLELVVQGAALAAPGEVPTLGSGVELKFGL